MTALGPLYQRGRLAGAAARRVRAPHLLLLLLLLTLSRPRGGYVARAGDDESPPVRSTPRGFEDTAPVPFPSRRPHAVRARAPARAAARGACARRQTVRDACARRQTVRDACARRQTARDACARRRNTARDGRSLRRCLLAPPQGGSSCASTTRSCAASMSRATAGPTRRSVARSNRAIDVARRVSFGSAPFAVAQRRCPSTA